MKYYPGSKAVKMGSRNVCRVALCLLAVSSAFFISGCPATTGMKQSEQLDVMARYQGKRMFLRSSVYYGPFYGDRYSYLVAPRRFEELRQLDDQNERPITPGPALGIIPAGREVRIERIVFPPAERPLLTPRFYPWVYMLIDKTFTDKPHILVLQPDPVGAREFDQVLGAFLTERDPRPGIDGRPAAIRDAIDSKGVAEGMTPDDVTAALGYPDAVWRGGPAGEEKWTYPSRCVTFGKGVVTGYYETRCK